MENGLNCKVSKEQNVRMIYNVELWSRFPLLLLFMIYLTLLSVAKTV
jgi:hypothetical protein